MARTGQFRLILEKAATEQDVRKVIAALGGQTPTKSKPVEVIVRPQIRVPSRAQTNYYWAILRETSNHSGHDADVLDVYLRRKFLGTRVEIIGPDPEEVPISITTLDSAGMSKLIDDVKHWAGLHLDIAFEEEASA